MQQKCIRDKKQGHQSSLAVEDLQWKVENFDRTAKIEKKKKNKN